MANFFTKAMQLVQEEKDRRGSFRALCEPLGLNATTVQKWFTEKKNGAPRAPGIDQLGIIMDAMGVQIVAPGERLATYDFIPCGTPYLEEGILKIREFPHAPIAMESFWMQDKGIFAQNAVMIEVSDDSMSPLYAPRDLVLVDRADVEPKNGGIYLMSDDKGEILLRRMKSEVGTGWTLLPENQSWLLWAQKTIPDLSHIKIHGRVRWSCRSFG